MTRVDIAPLSAGWYPDPGGASATRFWDGSGWTDHVKDRGARFAPSIAAATAEPGRIAPLVTLPRNGIATASLVLGVVSLVANLLLVPSILAIGFGAVGVVRAARFGGSGRGPSVTGTLLGVLGLAAVLIQLALVVPVLLGLQHDAQLASLRSTVISQAAGEGVRLTDVACPADADLRAQGTFTCDTTVAGGSHVAIVVAVTPDGHWTWRPFAAG